jgi:hypothetical protein
VKKELLVANIPKFIGNVDKSHHETVKKELLVANIPKFIGNVDKSHLETKKKELLVVNIPKFIGNVNTSHHEMTTKELFVVNIPKFIGNINTSKTDPDVIKTTLHPDADVDVTRFDESKYDMTSFRAQKAQYMRDYRAKQPKENKPMGRPKTVNRTLEEQREYERLRKQNQREAKKANKS